MHKGDPKFTSVFGGGISLLSKIAILIYSLIMLYTGKGDNGKTTTFGCNQKISKRGCSASYLKQLNDSLTLLKSNDSLNKDQICSIMNRLKISNEQ
jgi:hypothetical protein